MVFTVTVLFILISAFLSPAVIARVIDLICLTAASAIALTMAFCMDVLGIYSALLISSCEACSSLILSSALILAWLAPNGLQSLVGMLSDAKL